MAQEPQADKSNKLVLCPYCGHTQPADTPGERCEVCRGLFEPLSRRATQIAMGPWFIRDRNNPFRPGCSYEVLLRQIEAGRVKPTTILRGPTTRQFWSVARNVPGVAHHLGYCHACGAHVKPGDKECSSCHERFRTPKERNELGLLYTTASEAAAAQRQLEAELKPKSAMPSGRISVIDEPAAAPSPSTAEPGADLLDQVIGKIADRPSPPPGKAALSKPASPERDLPPRRVDTSATKPGGETLDFGPSADTAPSTRPSIDIGIGRSSLMTWLLVIGNVLVLALIVLLVLKSRPAAQQQSAPAPTPPVVTPPVAPEPAAPSVSEPTEPPAAPAIPSDEPTPSETPEASEAPALREDATLHELADRLDQVTALEEKGELEQAVILLRELAAKLPEDRRPLGLDSRIRSLEDRIAHRKTATFFGVPTDR